MAGNPFKPGNGIDPAYMAGRQEHITEFGKMLKTIANGLPRNLILYGIRGTGKTVLMQNFKAIAQTEGWAASSREFSQSYSKQQNFAQAFSQDLVTLAKDVSIQTRIAETGKKILEYLKPEELTAYGITYKPYYAQSNQLLDDYLYETLKNNWVVFHKAGKKGVLLFFDEFHTVTDSPEQESYVLSSLLSAMAKTQREGLKYALILSGLPPLKTNLKAAKTYSERMFSFREVANLLPEEAAKAITEPLKNTSCKFTPGLVQAIAKETAGYPYFIQFYCHYLVDNAQSSQLAEADLGRQRPKIIALLDKSFFEDRYALATDQEKAILEAMASKTVNGECRLSDLKGTPGVDYGAIRKYLPRLIDKGLVYKQRRAIYSFSIPLFREYLLRQN